MPGVTTAYQTGNHAGRPANGAGCILYSCTTHGLIYRDDGTSWTTFLTTTLNGYTPGGTDVAIADGGTGASTKAAGFDALSPMTTSGDIIYGGASGTGTRLAKGTDGQVLKLASGLPSWAAEGGSGAADPVADILGTPDTAYEFGSSSLAGLTAIGSPTVEAAHTSVPGHLYYKDSTSSAAWMGRYQASPSTPFTIVTKVTDADLTGNYNACGLLVGVADPTSGAFVTNVVTWNSNRKFNAEKFTNRTTFGSTVGGGENNPGLPVYLAMVVNSTSSIDYYWSFNGYSWRKYVSANNPSLTVGSVGLAMKSENASGFSCAFDYLRIWNSAKTFL